ncbi:SH2 domain-containing protein 4A isoform X2 [Bufo bufo]|uniref:SH2 domain-containing protein 4A isoform X2 n=1 Tax=Bufo bufo TaxID=8384 RepID=UPI001ABE9870|nr:SH2 domain-containing protein 4A isoform X2 [Bufo bufo]
MLKQILADMYIDPDLLAELSEEQKQILFFKMREEQVRRWKEKEATCEQNTKLYQSHKPKKNSQKTVHWKFGSDQEVWVWVMGEHSKDKPYDIICDEIIEERARKQAEREAEERRKVQEEELSKLSEALKLAQRETVETWKQNVENKKTAKEETTTTEQKSITETPKTRTIQDILLESNTRHSKKCGVQQKKTVILGPQEKEKLEERTQEIYMNWKEAQEVKQKLEKEDSEWQETLRKSKAADERRRSMAKQARDDYKRLSMQAIERGTVAEKAKNFGGEIKRPPLPPKPRPAKTIDSNSGINRSERRQGIRRVNSSSTRENIIKWFKEEQLPLQAGWDRSGTCMAPWFHGIISRAESEDLLKNQVPGSFLLRVSEKIHGYVLSYRSKDGYMHFLIDASGTSYFLLGVDQIQYGTLADLVEYHKTEPITSLGKELLLYPCGQLKNSCDYSDLIE